MDKTDRFAYSCVLIVKFIFKGKIIIKSRHGEMESRVTAVTGSCAIPTLGLCGNNEYFA